MSGGKPIIGLTGGIGSGKSFAARLLSELGCLVIDSDQLAREAYEQPEVRAAIRQWWNGEVFLADGRVNRRALALKIFANAHDRQRLERLIHPIVDRRRGQIMESHRDDLAVRAFVWDVPLLFETGLNRRCDAVIFVESSPEDRLERLRRQRGWNPAELELREKAQWPLDKKCEMSDHVIRNSANAGDLRNQIQHVLSLILSKKRD